MDGWDDGHNVLDGCSCSWLCSACLRCVKGWKPNTQNAQKKIIVNRSSRIVGGWASEPNSQANRMRADEGQTGGSLTQSQQTREREQKKEREKQETKRKGRKPDFPIASGLASTQAPEPLRIQSARERKDHRCDGRIESVIALEIQILGTDTTSIGAESSQPVAQEPGSQSHRAAQLQLNGSIPQIQE